MLKVVLTEKYLKQFVDEYMREICSGRKIQKLIKKIDKKIRLVRCILFLKISWLAYVNGMDKSRMPKRMISGFLVKKRGRPSKQWLQDVEDCLKKNCISQDGE